MCGCEPGLWQRRLWGGGRTSDLPPALPVLPAGDRVISREPRPLQGEGRSPGGFRMVSVCPAGGWALPEARLSQPTQVSPARARQTPPWAVYESLETTTTCLLSAGGGPGRAVLHGLLGPRPPWCWLSGGLVGPALDPSSDHPETQSSTLSAEMVLMALSEPPWEAW